MTSKQKASCGLNRRPVQGSLVRQANATSRLSAVVQTAGRGGINRGNKFAWRSRLRTRPNDPSDPKIKRLPKLLAFRRSKQKAERGFYLNILILDLCENKVAFGGAAWCRTEALLFRPCAAQTVVVWQTPKAYGAFSL